MSHPHKTLIVSDIHLRHAQIDQMLLWEEPYDRVICLNDVFDQFADSVIQNLNAAHWFKTKLNDPRWVFVESNHGQSYRWPTNVFARCSGFSTAKAEAINAILTRDDWLKVRPYYAIPEFNLLFTHAGVDRHLPTMAAARGFEAPVGELTLKVVTDWLDAIWPSVLVRYDAEAWHPLLGVGRDRGGDQSVGGITWGDFGSHTPIPGIAQVVGHSIRETPLFRFHQGEGVIAPMWRRADKGPIKQAWLKTGWTLDMDTNLHHYAILNTTKGLLTIKQVNWKRHYGDDTFTVTRGPVIANVKLPRVRETSPSIAPIGA